MSTETKIDGVTVTEFEYGEQRHTGGLPAGGVGIGMAAEGEPMLVLALMCPACQGPDSHPLAFTMLTREEASAAILGMKLTMAKVWPLN